MIHGSKARIFYRIFVLIVGDCFNRSVPFVNPPYPKFFAACCRCVRMSINRANLGGNKNFLLVINIVTSLHLRPHVLCRRFCPHHTQMTGTRQDGDSTTLRVQPCRTAVVGYIMYVRVAGPSYAAASCFCRSLSSFTPPYRKFLLCAAAAWVCYAILPLRGCAMRSCRCVGVLCDPAARQQSSPLAAAAGKSMRVWLLL